MGLPREPSSVRETGPHQGATVLAAGSRGTIASRAMTAGATVVRADGRWNSRRRWSVAHWVTKLHPSDQRRWERAAMKGERVDISTQDGVADAYLSRPPGQDGSHTGVLFIMDAFGLRPRIEEMVDRLAARGVVGLAPNVLSRAGRGAHM